MWWIFSVFFVDLIQDGVWVLRNVLVKNNDKRFVTKSVALLGEKFSLRSLVQQSLIIAVGQNS